MVTWPKAGELVILNSPVMLVILEDQRVWSICPPRKNLGRDYAVSNCPNDLTAFCWVPDYHFSINTDGDNDAQATGL